MEGRNWTIQIFNNNDTLFKSCLNFFISQSFNILIGYILAYLPIITFGTNYSRMDQVKFVEDSL